MLVSKEVVDKVDNLETMCATMVSDLKGLQEAADTTAKRLVRAGKLTGGLADEGVRWTATVAELDVPFYLHPQLTIPSRATSYEGHC